MIPVLLKLFRSGALDNILDKTEPDAKNTSETITRTELIEEKGTNQPDSEWTTMKKKKKAKNDEQAQYHQAG